MPLTFKTSTTTNLWIIFFVNGAVLSSWAPRIPEVKESLGLSDGRLGLALLGIAAGSVPSLLLTARLLNRVRSAPVCVVTALVFAGALPLIGVARDGAQLTAVLVLLGAASGVLDVAMNTFAITYQEHTGHRVLSRLHGGYSLGVLAGAGGGVVATHVGASVTVHFAAVAAVLLTASIASAPALWPQDHGTAGPAPAPAGRAPCSLPLTIAVLAVCGLLIEGVVTDWSALLITRDLGSSHSLAATALAVFSLAMFVSRSAGDLLLDRFSERHLLTAVAVTVAGLVAAGYVIDRPLPMVLAVGLIGLTLGPVFPVAVYRASRSAPGRAAAMTARVSAVGYIAYLGGPPVVGFVADRAGLPVTFAAVVLLSCAGILAARRDPA